MTTNPEMGEHLSVFEKLKIHNHLRPEKQVAFLDALRKRKMNISAACAMVGISRSAVYKQRQVSERFAEAIQEIEEELLDDLEEKQFDAASERHDDRRYTLSRRRGDRWSEKSATIAKVEIEHRDAKEMSDAELIKLVQRDVGDGEQDDE